MLSPAHKSFFDTFGFLHLPGILRQDIGWIIDEFESVWTSRPDIVHDGSKRTMFPETFITMTPRLSQLIEDPRIVDICTTLMGEGYTLAGGDGNLYAGDTSWHSDCGNRPAKTTVRQLKIAFYLDSLTRATGALRVIPGSHLHGDQFAARLETSINRLDQDFGIRGEDVPCLAIESAPGDLVLLDHRTKHAAFGGGNRRRMFTTNWYAGTNSQEEQQAQLIILRAYWDDHHMRAAFRAGWFESAPPERRRYLQNHQDLVERLRQEKSLPVAAS